MAAVTDETLMAYADGALPADEARTVAALLAADPAIAARVEMFRRSRQRTRDALAPLAAEPVPDALTARILAAASAATSTSPAPAARAGAAGAGEEAGGVAGNVLPFRSRTRLAPLSWGAALAASLALVVGLGAGYTIGERGSAVPGEAADGLLPAPLGNPALASALSAALSTVPAGTETALGSDRFRAIASFRTDGGALCREFEVDSLDTARVTAVACRPGERWQVTFSVASAATLDGYAPVSALEALEGYLGAVGASPPLEPADEAAALAALPNSPR